MTQTAESNVIDSGVLNLKPVQDALPDLRAQCQRKIDAAESFNDACKAVAEKCGDLKPAVLSAYVTALVRGKEDDFEAKCRQMDLLADMD